MKKLASILALTAVVANLGVSAVFAQVDPPASVTGSQEIDCGAPSATFSTTNIANNFQIGYTGSRNVASSNDTSYIGDDETNVNPGDGNLNSARFGTLDPLHPESNTDTDDVTIESTTPYSCGGGEYGVLLTVEATPFSNGTNGLVTYGSDNLAGGDVGTSAEDYYAVFSVITSAPMTCSGSCVLAQGAVESLNGIKNGQNNFFLNAGPDDKTLAASFDSGSVLVSSANTENTVTLYNVTQGFEGSVTVPGLDYNLALPANLEVAGNYASIVTYTLATAQV